MGIFDSKQKKEEAERHLAQTLSRLPLLNGLVNSLIQEDDSDWMFSAQSYYDSRLRTVTIAKDLFEIKWARQYEESVQVGFHQDGSPKFETQRKEEIYGRAAFSYTASGYLPLHDHLDEKGKPDVNLGRVCYIWASLIRDRMSSRMPKCEFRNVSFNNNSATFTYMVPAQTFKDWF